MTGNKFLLDTNIVTAWLKGEVAIANRIDKAQLVYIPVITIGELFYGAMYSTRVEKNIADISKIASNYSVLEIDKNVALAYGKIKAALRRKGSPIPENDIWIAAIAEAHNLILVSRDKHFKQIETLKVRDWK